jgi:hypothetical protein
MNSILLLLVVDMGFQAFGTWRASGKPEIVLRNARQKEYPCPGCALSQASKDRGFLKCEDYYTQGLLATENLQKSAILFEFWALFLLSFAPLQLRITREHPSADHC